MSARHGVRGVLIGALALAVLDPGAAGQEQVQMRRFSDVVAVRPAPGQAEHILYYFDPIADLAQGGEVEQGSGGLSEIYLSGGAKIILRASGHAVLETLAPEGDVVRFPLVTFVEVQGGSRPLLLELPTGVLAQVNETSLLIEATPGRLRLRNQRGDPVAVTGPDATQPTPLAHGEEIIFPLIETQAPHEQSLLTWDDLAVRYSPGVQVTQDGQRLIVAREADGELHAEAPLSVGGVATRPGAGQLVIRDPRVPPPQTAPAAPATPAATPAPAVVPPQPAPKPGVTPAPVPAPDQPETSVETQR